MFHFVPFMFHSCSILSHYVSFLYFSGSNKYAATYYNGIYRSTNNGVNWIQINSGLTNLTIGCIAELNGNLYLGTNGNGVLMSSNSGDAWITTGLDYWYINSLAVINNVLFAGANSGIFRSTNYGANWTIENTGLQNNYIWSLRAIGTNLFAGTESGGVYLSTNNGNFWLDKSNGFNPNPPIFFMYLHNNFLFAGTNGQSVWRRSYSEIIGIQNISTEIPTSFSLGQNYPNPFNPSTVVRFSIPEGFLPGARRNDRVELKVFDVMGREVQTLVNERLQAGSYEVTFDGSGLNSGVYFYRMVTEGYVETKRMILLR